MKKIVKYLVFIMVMESVLVCFSGCNLEDFKRHRNNDENTGDAIIVTDEGDIKYQKEFGTYIVKSGWVESKTHSGNGKYFYVKEGQDNDTRPNNISINGGTNKYTKSEHEQFKDAIYVQLARQVSGNDSEILANGSTTEQGEILYTFVIKSSELTCTQYYIVGEKKYVMIYESVWNNDEEKETDEVALKMVNSFKWLD